MVETEVPSAEVPTSVVHDSDEHHEECDSEEDADGDREDDDKYSDPQDAYDDFMLTLTREQRKMLSVLLYESFQTRQRMSKMDTAQK